MDRLRYMLMTSISLLVISFGNEIKVVAVDPQGLVGEQRANHRELGRRARVASQGWQKPGRRWPGRLY